MKWTEFKERWLKNYPRYNPATNEILGCEPSSFEWWHEKRHEWQEQEYSLATFAARIEIPLLTIAMLSPLFPAAWWALFAYFTFILALEMDANIYATKRVGFNKIRWF